MSSKPVTLSKHRTSDYMSHFILLSSSLGAVRSQPTVSTVGNCRPIWFKDCCKPVYCLTLCQSLPSVFGYVICSKNIFLVAMHPASLMAYQLHMWDSGGICVLMASSLLMMFEYCLQTAIPWARWTNMSSLSCSEPYTQVLEHLGSADVSLAQPH